MRKNDLLQLKKVEAKELAEQAKRLQDEVVKLYLEKSSGKITDLKTIAKKRRDRAQVLTVLRQKQLLTEMEKANAS